MHDLGLLAQDISILHRSYYKDTAVAFRKYGLNPTAVCILLAVRSAPGINQQRISEYLAIDKGLTTREVSKLEDAGYVQRVSGRGKSLALDITPVGERIVGEVSRIRAGWWRERFRESGVDEHTELLSGIERVVHTLTGTLGEDTRQ